MRFTLKEMRKQAGFQTAKNFAEHLGMPVGTYVNYEQGKRRLTLERAWEFTDELGCTLDELAGRRWPPPRPRGHRPPTGGAHQMLERPGGAPTRRAARQRARRSAGAGGSAERDSLSEKLA